MDLVDGIERCVYQIRPLPYAQYVSCVLVDRNQPAVQLHLIGNVWRRRESITANGLAGKRLLDGRADLSERKDVPLRPDIRQTPVQDMLDLGLEGHDAAREPQHKDESAGNQRRVEMQVEQEPAHRQMISALLAADAPVSFIRSGDHQP